MSLHLWLSSVGILPEDTEGLTAPVIFSYPASAQLAARIDRRDIELDKIENATAALLRRYDRVLIEGVGGLYVPITDDYFTIDYVADHHIPLVLVTNGQLGSINHTILSLEAIKAKGIWLKGVIYNQYYDTDTVIAADTAAFVERYLRKHFPDADYLTLPVIR